MSELESDQLDILLRHAIREIAECSEKPFGISAIQRKLWVGYNTGAGLMKTAEKRGLVKRVEHLFQANF